MTLARQNYAAMRRGLGVSVPVTGGTDVNMKQASRDAAGQSMSTALSALQEIADMGPEEDPGKTSQAPTEFDEGATAALYTTAMIARKALTKIFAIVSALDAQEEQT